MGGFLRALFFRGASCFWPEKPEGRFEKWRRHVLHTGKQSVDFLCNYHPLSTSNTAPHPCPHSRKCLSPFLPLSLTLPLLPSTLPQPADISTYPCWWHLYMPSSGFWPELSHFRLCQSTTNTEVLLQAQKPTLVLDSSISPSARASLFFLATSHCMCNPSSQTRDQTCVPCSGSAKS